MNDIENKIDQISDEALDQVAGGLNLGPMPGDGIKKKSDLDPTQKTYTDEELAALAARSQAIGKIGGEPLHLNTNMEGLGELWGVRRAARWVLDKKCRRDSLVSHTIVRFRSWKVLSIPYPPYPSRCRDKKDTFFRNQVGKKTEERAA